MPNSISRALERRLTSPGWARVQIAESSGLRLDLSSAMDGIGPALSRNEKQAVPFSHRVLGFPN